MPRRRQKWCIGDVFVIELANHTYAVAQIVGREADVLNSVTIALFDQSVSQPNEAIELEINPQHLFSMIFTTRDLLDNGIWRVVGNREVSIPQSLFPFEHLRNTGEWVGAKIYGSGIINEFVNAYHGLMPWNDWKDPSYLDKLLISPEKKPKNLIYKSTA